MKVLLEIDFKMLLLEFLCHVVIKVSIISRVGYWWCYTKRRSGSGDCLLL